MISLSPRLPSAQLQLSFLGFGSNRSEKVGDFEADVYQIANLRLISRVRSEHLDPKAQGTDTPAPAAAASASTLPAPAGIAGTPAPSDSPSAIPDRQADATPAPEAEVRQFLAQVEAANVESEEERAKLLKKLDGKGDDEVEKYVLVPIFWGAVPSHAVHVIECFNRPRLKPSSIALRFARRRRRRRRPSSLTFSPSYHRFVFYSVHPFLMEQSPSFHRRTPPRRTRPRGAIRSSTSGGR